MTSTDTARLTAWVIGQVQGVGFRWWVNSQAKELGLSGSATNLADGRVCVVAEGPRGVCEELLHRLSAPQEQSRRRLFSPGRPGRVDTVVPQWSEPKGVSGFQMR